MKVYKVPLYEVHYGYPKSGVLVYVDTVLVKEGHFMAKEILTGYSSIDIVSSLEHGKLDVFAYNRGRVEKYGHHLIVLSKDLVPKNLAVESDIDSYVSGYDDSEWKKVYEEMKILSKKRKQSINQKIKSIYATKK